MSLAILVVMFVAIALVAVLLGYKDSKRLPVSHHGTHDTPSGRLRRSKETGFFDGENEYYTEAMNRVRTSGGSG